MKFKKCKLVTALIIVICIFIQSVSASAVNLNIKNNCADGISSLFPFSTVDTVRAGVVKVNQKTQELVIERTDLSLPGGNLPIDISFYYSSFSNSKNKWHFNYDISFEKKDNTIIFTRNDGSKVVYEPTGQILDGKEKWIIPEEFGMFDYLLVPTVDFSCSDVVLVTKFYGIYYFNDSGLLDTIRSKDSKNYIKISYDNSNRIESIIDDIGRCYKISYNKSDYIEEISVYDTKNAIITFDNGDGNNVAYTIKYNYTNGRLTSIEYPDSYCINYTYKNGKLVEIENANGETYEIEYSSDYVNRINQIADNKKKNIVEISTKNNELRNLDQYESSTNYDFYNITPEMIKKAADEYMVELRKANAEIKQSDGSSINNNVLTENNAENFNNNIIDFSYNLSINETTGKIDALVDNCDNSLETKYDYSNKLLKMSAAVSYLTEDISNVYTYEADLIKSISRNGIDYSFLYDEWGNNSGIMIQDNPYVKYVYKDGKSELCEKIEYGNGQVIYYYYDLNNMLTGVGIDGDIKLYEYYYDDQEIKIVDNTSGLVQIYFNDSFRVLNGNTNEILFEATQKNSNTLSINIGKETIEQSIGYSSIDKSSDYKIVINYLINELSTDITVIKDELDRITKSSAEYSNGYKLDNVIEYLQYEANKTYLPRQFVTSYYNENLKYTKNWEYDYYDNGKIKNICLNGVLYSHYIYDEIGQLLQVDDYVTNMTTEYMYDKGGNVINKKSYDLNAEKSVIDNVNFCYDNLLWKDQLTSYNNFTISYDEIGNPLSYKDVNFSWSNGRELSEYSNSKYKIEYTYNDMGYRQTKEIYNENNDIMYKYHYFWGNGYIYAYTLTDYTLSCPKTDSIVYQYDDSLNVCSYTVNGCDLYVYEKNALGDIVAVYNEDSCVAQYHYDDAGNIVVLFEDESVANYNHLSYRGYIYDKESNLYYLHSRYYSPEWGRFLNADIYVDTGTGLLGTNMYIYCDNDPINKIDPTGYWGISIHRQITHYVLSGETLSYNLDVDKIADGNAATDSDYSPIIITANNQGRHFDRHIKISEANGEDTRGYFASIHMQEAINAYNNQRYNDLNKQLGYALHCIQDTSAHGNIDVNRSAYASHVGVIGADETDYEWKYDDRGATNKFTCLKKVDETYGARYYEAAEATAWIYVLFIVVLSQS